ncbi:hypothetical protein [Actibacterium atlanticum]|nr:hypothetical protein [Actibacterium atlanticum]
MYDADPRLHPERVGLNDTDLRKKLPCDTVEDVKPLWAVGAEDWGEQPESVASDLHWRRAKPLQARGAFGHLGKTLKGNLLPAFVRLTCNYRPDVDLLQPFKAWCRLYKPTQAYLHYVGAPELEPDYSYTITPEQIKSGYRSPEMVQKDAWSSFIRGTFGPLRRQKTLNLGWVNYFPKEFVQNGMPEELEAIGVTVEPFAEGYILQLGPSLGDVKTDFRTFSELRHQAKGVLGRERFVIEEEPLLTG